MNKVRFIGYLKNLAGVSEIQLNSKPRTVHDALLEITARFPNLKNLILDDVPEVSFILGEKTLVTPRDFDLKLDDELIIGPIVGGG